MQVQVGSNYILQPQRVRLLPPSTSGQAVLLPGSRQWPASRGSYNVFTLCDIENPFQTPDATTRRY